MWTYDKKGFSARVGLTHNDGYIWSYAGAANKGPGGDTYLYPHTQVERSSKLLDSRRAWAAGHSSHAQLNNRSVRLLLTVASDFLYSASITAGRLLQGCAGPCRRGSKCVLNEWF